LLTIIGLASKDAILIIEFARTLHAHGKSLVEAAIEAATLRMRPILMTGFAFVFGVTPMVIATGASGKSQQALGTGVMGGMIAVVILALMMVPTFYVVVQKFFERRGHPPEPPSAIGEKEKEAIANGPYHSRSRGTS
jgi:multidrug efflux pump